MRPPCKECRTKKENYLGCHSECEKYIKYKEALEEENLAKKRFFETNYARAGFISKKQLCTMKSRVWKDHKK